MNAIDISGHCYGRLMAVRRVEPSRHPSRWECRCSCGAIVVVALGDIRNGATRSCGCLRRERTKERMTKHGHARGTGWHPLYRTWLGIRRRCTNPKARGWRYYGGRGIQVCERWRDFSVFLADVGERPHGMTLDRINPDGDYEPANVRWATWKQQRANRSSRRYAVEVSNGH